MTAPFRPSYRILLLVFRAKGKKKYLQYFAFVFASRLKERRGEPLIKREAKIVIQLKELFFFACRNTFLAR